MEFKNLREQMNRFFANAPDEEFLDLRPSIDLYEKNGDIVIEADIPGIDPYNIEINVSENYINIKGKTEQKKDLNEENYHRVERKFGSFNRTISLPTRVDHKNAQANTRNGVLEIVVPKLNREVDDTTHLRLEKNK
jgi:HSP20 family protein